MTNNQESTTTSVDGSLLSLDKISSSYGPRAAIRQVSMEVKEGSQVCLLGPSGSGKTTILRAIAGFQRLSSGTICINGAIVSNPGYELPTEQRRVGMVFQDHALFPHLTIAENVGAGLRKLTRNRRRKQVLELLDQMGLGAYSERHPHELSGGEQQRVALARALAIKPILLLMDEPFSSLDLELRETMTQEISDFLKSNNITCIMVTHDQNDAFAIASEIGVMRDGQIVQWDTPYNLYHQPANRFVADFIGNGVFVEGTVISPGVIHTSFGELQASHPLELASGTAVEVLIRPDDVVPSSDQQILAKVVRLAFKGAEILYTLETELGGVLLGLFPSHTNYSVGQTIGIQLEVDHVVAFRRLSD
ncbi:MAG: ABC transporter ATP-binding protein [Acidiferrobacteraceae bacterium]|nr:ABC transporter ATP-binding protein [Acidiferrobacteraceae bacterium]